MNDPHAIQRPPTAPRVTTHLRCDADHCRIPANTSPANAYRFVLQRALRNVRKVRLTQVKIPMSPVFTLVRISAFKASGTLLAATDTFHQMAVRMASSIGSDPSKSGYTATITNPAGTVALQVYDVVTINEARASDSAYRTYDCLICTGTVSTSTYSDWLISAEGETANTEITPVADSATMYVRRDALPAVLRVRLNGTTVGRVSDPFEYEDQWKSYKVYYPGQIVQYSGTRYVCNTKHMSTTFASNQTALYWTALSATALPVASPNDNAFNIFDCPYTNQTTLVERPNGDLIAFDVQVDNLREIEVQWVTNDGQLYIFPYDSALSITTIAATDTTTYDRVYQMPAFDLDVEHDLYGR
jgi:hypothetical protein